MHNTMDTFLLKKKHIEEKNINSKENGSACPVGI